MFREPRAHHHIIVLIKSTIITILSYKETCVSEMALECDAAIIWKHQITQIMLDYLLLKQGSQQCLRVQHGSTLPVGYSKQ